MAQIVETIVGDRRIQLANEELVRQMSFGARWSKLRIGVRWSINGTANITAPELVVGVCCGLTNTYKSSNTDFVFGLRIPGTNSGTGQNLNYTSGPPAYYTSSSSLGFDVLARTGNTTTKTHNAGVTTYGASTANTSPGVLAVDITRTGTVYTVTQFVIAGSTGAIQAGNTFKQMLIGMDSETGTPWDNMTASVLSGSNTATDSHLCDCVTVYWSGTSPTAEISDVQVVRFA